MQCGEVPVLLNKGTGTSLLQFRLLPSERMRSTSPPANDAVGEFAIVTGMQR